MKTIFFCISFLAAYAYGQGGPAGQESLLVRTIKRGPGIIYSAAFSPDGKYLAAGGVVNTLEIWNAEDGSLVRTLKGHKNFINSVAFSPDGKLLASASEDNTVKLWNVEDGSCLNTLKGHRDAVTSLAFFPDGNRLASASNDGTIRLWQLASATTYKTLKPRSGYIYSVAVSSAGTRLAAGNAYRTIKLWNLESGGREMTLEGHLDAVNAVAFPNKGNYLASGGEDGAVKLWRLTDGLCVMTLSPKQPVFAVSYSPDGEHLFSGGRDNMVSAWKVSDGTLLRTFPGHSALVRSLAISPDGKYLASGSFDRTIKLWLTPWEAERRTREVREAAEAEAETNRNYELHYSAGLQLASSALVYNQAKAVKEFEAALTFKQTEECAKKLKEAVSSTKRMARTSLTCLLAFLVLLAVGRRISRARKKAVLLKTLPGEIKSETFAGSYENALKLYADYKAIGGKPESLPREELLDLYRGLSILDELAKEELPCHFLLSYAVSLAKEGNYRTAVLMLRSGRLVTEFKTPGEYDVFVDIYEKAGKPENLLMVKLEPAAYSTLAEAFYRVEDYKCCAKVCALKKQFHADKLSQEDNALLAACQKNAGDNTAPSENTMVRWKCINCGQIHEGNDLPDTCPVCGHTKEHFKAL